MNTLPARLTPPKLLQALLAPMLALSLMPTPAHALWAYQQVWSEDFNDIASFEGAPVSTLETSEYWTPAYYFNANNGASNWSFASGAYFATNGNGDGAILLNERGADGASSQTQPLASIKLTGLVVGYHYSVSFNYWGDNYAAPGHSYDLTTFVDGQLIQSFPTESGSAGSLTSPHFASISFLASATTIDLGFGQIATDGTSPIVDHISMVLAEPWKTQDPVHSVPAVPEPNTASLTLLGGLLLAARWITAASRSQRRE